MGLTGTEGAWFCMKRLPSRDHCAFSFFDGCAGSLNGRSIVMGL
jgi:hypothetical protein